MPIDTSPLPAFPAYLLPTLPFPRRQSGATKRRTSSTASISSSLASAFSSSPTTTPLSSANTTPSSSPPRMTFLARRFNSFSTALQEGLREDDKDYREDAGEKEEAHSGLGRAQPDTLKCSTCATDIAFAEQIVSKGFTGRHGRAYLISPPAGEGMKDLVNTKVGKAVNRQLVTGAHVVADISCKVCLTVVGWKYVDAKDVAQRYKIGKFILETKKVVRGWSWEDGPHDERQSVKSEGTGIEEVEFDSEDEDECEEIFMGTWDRDVVAKRRAKRVGNRRRDG